MHPEILTVNKQVSTEAAEILYEENSFVVVKLDRANVRGWNTIQNIPRFKKQSQNQEKPVPALKIIIADRTYINPPLRTRLITGPEGIQPLIECFWRLGVSKGGPDGVFLQTKLLSLKLNSPNPAKLKKLQESLLSPFQHVQGFSSIFIYGTEKGFRRSLLERMEVAPTAAEALEVIEGNKAAAEQAYRNGNYIEALICWERVHLYQQWIMEQLLDTRYELEDLSVQDVLEYPALETLRSVLGEAKAFLRIGEYGRAVELAHRGLAMRMDDYEPWARSILRGKFDIIAAMAEQMMTHPTQRGTNDFWYPVTLLQEGPRSAKSLERVLKEYFLAKELYPADEWMELFVASKALWELMDNCEEEDGCGTPTPVDSGLEFPQKIRGWIPRAIGR